MDLQFTMSVPGLVLLIVGALMVVCPKLFWIIETKMYMKHGQPSNTYINVCRTGGFFFVIWAIALFLGAPMPWQLY